MKSLTQNAITVGTVLVILGGIYWYFFTGSPAQAPLSSTGAPPAAEQQFLTLTGELSTISFNTAIFSDPRFSALTDISVPITPEPISRTDPFAPLGE